MEVGFFVPVVVITTVMFVHPNGQVSFLDVVSVEMEFVPLDVGTFPVDFVDSDSAIYA